MLVFGLLEVGVHHELGEFGEFHLRLPAEDALGLRVIADEEVHLGRALIARVEFDEVLPVEADVGEGIPSSSPW